MPSPKDTRQLLAGILMAFVAFVPYFAVEGLGQVMGEKSLRTRSLKRKESP